MVAALRDGEPFRLEHAARLRPVLPAVVAAYVMATLGVVLGLLLLVVPGLFLATWWALIAPAVVSERLSWRQSLRRSRELVRGFGWTVFGVIALIGFAYLVLVLPLAWRTDFFSNWLLIAVADSLIAPFYAVAATIMYDRLVEFHGFRPVA